MKKDINDNLVEFFSYMQYVGMMSADAVSGIFAETFLDSNGRLDIPFFRDFAKATFGSSEDITKTSVAASFKYVFDAKMPDKFSFVKMDPAPESDVKRFLEQIYEPAKYLNARVWIWAASRPEHDIYLTKEQLFSAIMSTSKAKVYLGDLDERESR